MGIKTIKLTRPSVWTFEGCVLNELTIDQFVTYIQNSILPMGADRVRNVQYPRTTNKDHISSIMYAQRPECADSCQ
jgi:hypothetical protein